MWRERIIMNHAMLEKTLGALFESRKRLQGILLNAVRPLCEEVDRNWYAFNVKIERAPGNGLFAAINDREEIWSSYQGPPSFLACPVRAWMNAPSCGDHELDLERVANAIHPLIITSLINNSWYTANDVGFIVIANPDHALDVIPGITNFRFENCVAGDVLYRDDDGLIIAKYIDGRKPYALEHYSFARLEHELHLPKRPERGEVVEYDYLPSKFDYFGDPLGVPRNVLDVTTDEIQRLIRVMDGVTDAEIPMSEIRPNTDTNQEDANGVLSGPDRHD